MSADKVNPDKSGSTRPPPNRLITGGESHHFLPHLCAAINAATQIDMGVAFVKTTGLSLLLPDLFSALNRIDPPTRIRFLTSDYLDVTDPHALRSLMLLQEKGAQVRIFECGAGSFHLKTYVFAGSLLTEPLSAGSSGTGSSGTGSSFTGSSLAKPPNQVASSDLQPWGKAFVGSSNLSRQALTDGLEWNYRIDFPGDTGFIEVRARFEELFVHANTRPLTDAWIDTYEKRRRQPLLPIAPGSHETLPPPEPNPVQAEALQALQESRGQGLRRGLVVLATGLGKTWLAAFDAEAIGARRVLFVAHREEILLQAAETFLRIRPGCKVGFYTGRQRDRDVDILCASVQTLGKERHLDTFAPRHFDYVVVDEFHHAAALTYRQLLTHFNPDFLLGLTATPDRTDCSDILSLCDDNLVYTHDLFSGITNGLLAPFHYYGIFDESVAYAEIPWRNGRFDPHALSLRLATDNRAKHALRIWNQRRQQRTLAFCVSIAHADFMAEHFRRQGVAAAAIHGQSSLSRGEALEQLAIGQLAILFSVDLFNEGVDLPLIDTVMLLRPTESKVLFLQQLGRGLRRAEGKDKLMVLDFVGNHHSFLHKPQALLGRSMNYYNLARFANDVEKNRLTLPPGCFVNYDLVLINFLKSLVNPDITADYLALRETLGRRPTLTEFFRFGGSVQKIRKAYAHWFAFTAHMGDLDETEQSVANRYASQLQEIETTRINKSFKMVLLEAFQELNGWIVPPDLTTLANKSREVMERRKPLLSDLPPDLRNTQGTPGNDWHKYWQKNPVDHWTDSKKIDGSELFTLQQNCFTPRFSVAPHDVPVLAELVQEIIDYRLAAYQARKQSEAPSDNVAPFSKSAVPTGGMELPYFPNLKIACGHFKTGRTDHEETRTLPATANLGKLNPSLHFIARASGNSMNGGKNPIQDGDYLLLELIQSGSAGSITGSTLAIERQDASGDDQYLLREILKDKSGNYVLRARNPDYADIVVGAEDSEALRTFARLKGTFDPLVLAIGQRFLREDIPALFHEEFNAGNWHSGHVFLAEQQAQILLITLNKQGKADDRRYLDYWIDDSHFHWQTQNSTSPTNKRGKDIIEHRKRGLSIHLFVRENKLEGGKAAPFTYFGPVNYQSHEGSNPMSVILELEKSIESA
jgi:superfamily II DNA or RNA helicase/HKD family nuclease